MASLLSLKKRIQTARNVSKTTRAMQMISTSKLKRAQDAAVASKPYVEKLTFLSQSLSGKLDEEEKSRYIKEAQEHKGTLLLIFSPDKGLCGGLLTNLIRLLVNFDQENKDVSYITIGKKIEKTVLKLKKEIVASFNFGTTLPNFGMIYPVAKIIDDYFLGEKVSDVKILYTNFSSVFSQTPEAKTLLPIRLPEVSQSSSFTLFEPPPAEILPSLLRHYLEMSLYQIFLESYASEQAARMIAMKNATDNAGDIIDYLELEFNKERQERITNEILDIGGASFTASYA